MRSVAIIAVLTLSGTAAFADTFNLQADWSELSNPMGRWSLNQGAVLLPHVDSWQRNLGGWATAQPGWAISEDGNLRVPFFFKSNGTETFVHDFVAGTVVVHTTDMGSGSDNGPANVVFTVPADGVLSASGGVWMGRDIGRSDDWAMLLNGAPLTGGSLASGDPYSSAAPFAFNTGSGGPAALSNLAVHAGDTLMLRFERTSEFGDFVGIDLSVDFHAVPAPSAAGVLGIGTLLCVRRRRR
jgi:hypothetical protein